LCGMVAVVGKTDLRRARAFSAGRLLAALKRRLMIMPIAEHL